MAKLLNYMEFLAKQNSKKFEWFSYDVDKYTIHILFNKSEENQLTEAQHKGTSLGGKYSAKLHKAHSNVGQDHIYVYAKKIRSFL